MGGDVLVMGGDVAGLLSSLGGGDVAHWGSFVGVIGGW